MADLKHLSLLYHRVNQWTPDPWTLCVSPVHFAEQMEVVSRFTPRPIVTFDDGYADNLYQALPILERFDVVGRFFVASGMLGLSSEMWWDALERLFLKDGVDQLAYFDAFHRLRPLPFPLQQQELDNLFSARKMSQAARPNRRMMTEAELVKLSTSRLVQIGAHTVSHPVLSLLPRIEQQKEIYQSKVQLEKLTGKLIHGFAYPNGMLVDYTLDTVELVRQSGFSYAYSAFEHDNDCPFQLPRVMIRDWDGDQFAEVLRAASTPV